MSSPGLRAWALFLACILTLDCAQVLAAPERDVLDRADEIVQRETHGWTLSRSVCTCTQSFEGEVGVLSAEWIQNAEHDRRSRVSVLVSEGGDPETTAKGWSFKKTHIGGPWLLTEYGFADGAQLGTYRDGTSHMIIFLKGRYIVTVTSQIADAPERFAKYILSAIETPER